MRTNINIILLYRVLVEGSDTSYRYLRQKKKCSPLLSAGMREDGHDLLVQQRHLLEPPHVLPEFQLQAVASAVLGLQVLD